MLSHPHEVFLEVAQRLSFTKAGQALFISQSAVSKQVKALEEHYKTGLFERLGGSVQLTPAGQKLYQKLLQAKQLQQELRQEMSEASPAFAPAVHLLIGASTTISLYVLPPVVRPGCASTRSTSSASKTVTATTSLRRCWSTRLSWASSKASTKSATSPTRHCSPMKWWPCAPPATRWLAANWR